MFVRVTFLLGLFVPTICVTKLKFEGDTVTNVSPSLATKASLFPCFLDDC